MGIFRYVATGLAAVTALSAPVQASAASSDLQRAEKLQQLDVLLMVSSLRCRQAGSDFTTAYDHFSEVYATELSEARSVLEADYARRFGPNSVSFAVDRLSTRVANTYGEGHPALDCAELGEATRALASHSVPGGLEEAADQLLTTDLALADLAGDY